MSSASNIVHLRQSYQIKVTLSHIKPPIWRRLVIDNRVPLDVFHEAIQISMGWTNSHMHQFIDSDGMVYSQSYDDEFMPAPGGNTVEESAVLLNEVLKQEKDWIQYEYDFGDGWEHKVLLEKIIPHKKSQFPIVCLKGKRACPPEDCGGPWGYAHMLEQLADPEDEEEHAELLEWLGDDFEPENFDIEETNQVLQEIFSGVLFNGKAGLGNEIKRIGSEPESAEMDFDDFDPLNFDLEGVTSDLLGNPEVPVEVKQLVSGMQEAVEVVGYMDGMIELSIDAFEEIINISKDKKITAIAQKMLKTLDTD